MTFTIGAVFHFVSAHGAYLMLIIYLFYKKTDRGPKYRAKYCVYICKKVGALNIIYMLNVNRQKTTGPHYSSTPHTGHLSITRIIIGVQRGELSEA